MTKVFSMFSGIGGFELGLLMSERKVRLVGYSEVDKYAIKIFEKQFKGIKNYGDATTIDETKLPNFDLLVGGFPCQAFSVAGNLRGFDDTTGTLFFDVARILKHKKPKHFILENVRGLLSHDSGRTFQTILKVLSDIGYDSQWEVLNSKNYGVPQNRERVYIVGHLRGNSRPEVFPIGKVSNEDNRNNQQKIKIIDNLKGKGGHECHNVHDADGIAPTVRENHGKITMIETAPNPKEITKDMSMAYRVYDTDGVSTTLRAVGGGVGAKTGLYQVTNKPKTVALIPEEERPKGNYLPRERILSDEHISRAVSTSESQHPYYQVGVIKNRGKIVEREDSTRIDANYWKGIDNHGARTGVKVRACLTPDRAVKRQNGRRFKDNEEPMFTLTGQDKHGVMIDSSIRRLTPTECERLQGFPDGWTEVISDTQRYKCLGNAVTTNVVCEIAKRLLK